MAVLKKITAELLYNFERQGSFGRFQSGASFPVEYLMTTFSIHEIEKLSFARDIKSEQELDFELLMQRDIDDERVRTKIGPYLNPEHNPENPNDRTIFFPPLLAAIIPTNGKLMQEYYPNLTSKVIRNSDGVIDRIEREWGPLFKLSYLPSDSPNAYTISIDEDGENKPIGVSRDPVSIELRMIEGNQPGTRLVVIDGQHRLSALKAVYKDNSAAIENLVVPVCILFAPNSTKEETDKSKVPTVPEVFRRLFVDVNSTMELVGGHFNILLSDSIGSIACRKLCTRILNDFGKEGLALLEWNIKSKKDSTEINRKYSLASIGVIDKALEESIGNERLTSYLLNFAEVEDKLYPDDDAQKVKWEKFSLEQKEIIEKQVEEYLVPILMDIFFKTAEFKRAHEIFAHAINELKQTVSGNSQDASDAEEVLNQITEYIPIKEGKVHTSARNMYKKFEVTVYDKRQTETSEIIRYAIFHRSIISVLGRLLTLSRDYSLHPKDVSKGLIALLDAALKNQGKFFSAEKLYIQHAVFSAQNIKPRESTRKALSNLIVAHLGNPSVSKAVIAAMNVATEHIGSMSEKILEIGQKSAADYLSHFQDERKKTFRSTYRVDFSIEQDDRIELEEAEILLKQQQKEVRENKRAKDDVTKKFDLLIEKHVAEDLEIAGENLKVALGYDVDIIDMDGDENDA